MTNFLINCLRQLFIAKPDLLKIKQICNVIPKQLHKKLKKCIWEQTPYSTVNKRGNE